MELKFKRVIGNTIPERVSYTTKEIIVTKNVISVTKIDPMTEQEYTQYEFDLCIMPIKDKEVVLLEVNRQEQIEKNQANIEYIALMCDVPLEDE